MKFKDYSAVPMTFRFWYPEFISLLELLRDGYSPEEIKKKNDEENLFNANSKRRSKEIANALVNRIKDLDNSYIELFFNSNLETRKFLSLLTCLKEDRLMYELVYELIRPNLTNNYLYFTRSDLLRFFDNKITQSQKIAGWAPSTLEKLRSVYITMLTEAGVIKKQNDKFSLNRIYISKEAKDWIKENGYQEIYNALTGEKL